MNSRKIVFVVGPTAVGKTEAAVGLAERLGGEIVSCDAMQVYRDARIVSNKPSEEHLRRVRHHLIGVVPLEEEFNVAAFNARAGAEIEEIHGAGRPAVVCGGSGLYMQVLLDGIFDSGVGRTAHSKWREELLEQARREGNEGLYRELQAKDPAAAVKIHLNDTRRIVRALEVCRSQGEPISKLRAERSGLWGHCAIQLFCLNRDRNELYERINRRVDAMLAEGLVDEVKGLRSRNLSRTARAMIGIEEISEFLDGKYSLELAGELMKQNTRHLAKRQLTWFRREKRLEWIQWGSEDTVEKIVEMMLKH